MTIEMIADGLGFTEGPTYLPDGRVAVASVSHGCVYIMDPGGGSRERIDTGGGPNGLCSGSDGSIYVAQNGGNFGADVAGQPGVQVIRGGRVDYLAEGMEAPNDLMFGPDGKLWVTDTRAEMEIFHPDESKRGWLWTVDTATGAKELILESGPVWINGLGFSPDSTRLLVTATSGGQLVRYPIGAGCSLDGHAGELVCTFERAWPAGMVVRADGASWVALTGADRLDLVGETGETLDAVVLPDGALPTNVCLGADSADELLVTASYQQALLRIRLPA
ncbi:SMP-30/gluconolactonase/LRE family protein [Mycobacterium sp. 1081908.1]|uniref:SMP-30/gluconolactonase/LRE family protein n=1 Tax=Mycobacterium sp. 1081908.1 TaxID=1834066 RepID=UPI0018D2B677|nr:SMP-30/gluconolactonase/LRE family protein [Mycobacterium sp. 1081908.1]